MACKICKDLNEEKSDIEVSELRIDGGYFIYYVNVRHCPECGTILKRFARVGESDAADNQSQD